jgi:sugar fermentation stimulation protein A
VAARSLRHLAELRREVAAGARAVMLFVVQRGDCALFDAAADLDPAYFNGLTAATQAGVELLCYDCDISLDRIGLRRRLPWRGEGRTDPVTPA